MAPIGAGNRQFSWTILPGTLQVEVPAGRVGTFGLSIQHLNVQNTALTRPVLDGNGNPVLDPATGQPLLEITGFGSENDASFIGGWGIAMTRWLMVGGAAKLLVGMAGPVLGSGYGADAGVLASLPAGVRVGVAADDLGSTVVRWRDGTRTRIEPAGRVGVSWAPSPKWLLAVEGRSSLGRLDVTPSLGAEWKIAEALALRVGADNWRLTAGAGLRMPVGTAGGFAGADYAIVTGAGNEDRNRLTLTVGF